MSGLNQETFYLEDGVFISKNARDKFKLFENSYIAVRKKEQRILIIDQIRQLPKVSSENIHFEEWSMRAKSIKRFEKYLSNKPKGLRILDIGCGNGFFTHIISKNNIVVGVDVNLTELKQAALAFPANNISWYLCDILSDNLNLEKFDLITFCASFQYFSNPQLLILKCKSLLKPEGEIHIIDSPFYTSSNLEVAKTNSKNYYTNMKVEEMIPFYFHNTYKSIGNFSYSILYKPASFLNKLFRRKDSPFPWIKIVF